MSNKRITWTVFAIAALLVLAGFAARHVFGGSRAILQTIDEIFDGAFCEDWDRVGKFTETLHIQWNGYKHFIVLNYAQEDYSILENSICTIRAAGLCGDKQKVIEECAVAKCMIVNMGKFMPEP